MTDVHQQARNAAADLAYHHTNWGSPYILADRPTPGPAPERKLDVTVIDAARILQRRGAPERDVAPGTWDTLIDHPVWRSQAACTGMSPEFFYPERGQDGGQVRRLCQGCPVAAECLAYALNAGEVHGWWGGLSEKQIREVRCQLHRAKRRLPSSVPRSMPAADELLMVLEVAHGNLDDQAEAS